MRDWLPPEPPRAHPGWALASVLVHVAVVAALVVLSGRGTRDTGVSWIVLEQAPAGPVVSHDMAYVAGGGGGDGGDLRPGTLARRAGGRTFALAGSDAMTPRCRGFDSGSVGPRAILRKPLDDNANA